jgi:hypothetical protein
LPLEKIAIRLRETTGACHFCGGMSDWRVREEGVDVVLGKIDGPVWIDVVCGKVLGRDDTE